MARSRWAAGVRRQGRLAARLAVVVPLGMVGASVLGGSAALALSNCQQSGATETCTFSTPGNAIWTVPAGISQAKVTVDGAAGAAGGTGAGGGAGGAGGNGGQVAATLTSLSAGQVFTVSVGGAGQGPSSSSPGAGGINGGGPGVKTGEGAGGGGFSSVTGSALELLAGGGGGGGLGGTVGLPGGAGGSGGQHGTDGGPGVGSVTDESAMLGPGGGGKAGGDATDPGDGGTGGTVSGSSSCSFGAVAGVTGGNAAGGNGGTGFSGGGGGGGGYVGGGGGGAGASSCVDATGSGGGGGGSSFAAVPGAVFSTGVQSGNGQVTISYNAALAQLADLAQTVQDTRGGKGLGRTVALAEHQAAGRHPLLACQTLDVFIIEVQLDTPWRIPAGTAAKLIAAARQIQAALGCSSPRFYFPFRL